MKTHFKQTWENEFEILENEFQILKVTNFCPHWLAIPSSGVLMIFFYKSKLGTSIAWNCFMFSLNDTDRISKPKFFPILFPLQNNYFPSLSTLSVSLTVYPCLCGRIREQSGLPWPSPDSVITPLINQLQVIVPRRRENGVLIG